MAHSHCTGRVRDRDRDPERMCFYIVLTMQVYLFDFLITLSVRDPGVGCTLNLIKSF